ncbi:hypothetical protein ACFSTC_20510 [Nonomuraea ferruginea]
MPPGSPDDDRQACFEAALRAHHRDPQPYEQARTELVYGQWLRRTRRKRAARELLEASRERFDQLGARPWARRAAAELRATGDPRHGRAAGHVPRNLLTAQERQIARLASRGVRNRDIAAQLFLSPPHGRQPPVQRLPQARHHLPPRPRHRSRPRHALTGVEHAGALAAQARYAPTPSRRRPGTRRAVFPA